MHVLLPTLGSAGDVHPTIALALALRDRGHRATVITSPYFKEQIEYLGLGFAPVGTVEGAQQVLANPDLWHPRRGFEVIARSVMVPSIPAIYDAIASRADRNTVVVASGISFGARIAQDKLGIPTATLHLQPSIVRSQVDNGLAGYVRISASQPMWFKKAFFRLVDWFVVDKYLKRPINEFRASLGLAPVDRIFHQWIHSPDLVLAFFPEWFAPRQPDWPANLHCVGFVLWDAAGHAPVPPDAERFLEQGEPPVIFTPGSAASTLHRFFEQSVKALEGTSVRAMMVTNFPEQLPPNLPSNIRQFGYLPFSEVLPRAALLVHHGGIGTIAQAIKAGIPHLVVPNGHDQFDNGWRIEQLGLGVSIHGTRYKAEKVKAALRKLLHDEALRKRCREYADRIDSEASLNRACDLVEQLAARKLS
ncbi:MAG TPA: nucleotide disphospho-sugar-binding domain-containing protein [Terriglobales bacterium]|nr:nucleotide disphospho-sugar-binding domain-containing protein [Terriglobales bacterium]